MNYQEVINDVPRLGSTLRSRPIYLWENFFFHQLDQTVYDQAMQLAQQISQISRGKKTILLSNNSEIVGKVGEFVVREFCRQNMRGDWACMAEIVNDHGGDRCDFTMSGLSIDVKTRELHDDVTISPTMELLVPQTSFSRYQDVFILAGYCPATRYGYVFGWCSWEELEASQIRTDIKYPAHCVSLMDLHPMKFLEKYTEQRAKVKAAMD